MDNRVNAIWTAVYDESLDSDHYKGETVLSIDYDVLNAQIKDWQDINEKYSLVVRQTKFSSWIRVVLYTLGSLLIIVSKFPLEKVKE